MKFYCNLRMITSINVEIFMQNLIAREAIRSMMQTINKKPRKSVRKRSAAHIKKNDSVVSKKNDVTVTSSEVNWRSIPI
uniref:Uncharacterized protein n=1 Tax=Onchocerca volvulus TaxID=6282 RepID=A0A8R1XRP1_ONCVO